ncbi:hypothetical protein T265_02750 [Opisthorchis viverrini]|uniref:Uncharacterized protein n=1 Tax=Opisthorchis viverrini TaxID=6198 RepID=A0A075A5P0_OPIVI|nr:hypothetical protein T265_02750 [Opisthorchis viverrini]KER30940.1 hypothetical protein T265_02750 [Opisthorchis viverrini]
MSPPMSQPGTREKKGHFNIDQTTTTRDSKLKGHVSIGERGHVIKEQPMEPPHRITDRGQRSPPATSTHINTHVTLLDAQPLTHRYAQLRSLITH